jgi:hypothetical protein
MTDVAARPDEAVLSRAGEGAMVRLDAALAARAGREQVVGCTIAAADRERAEAIAQRYGYALRVEAVEEPGRVWAEFHPLGV